MPGTPSSIRAARVLTLVLATAWAGCDGSLVPEAPVEPPETPAELPEQPAQTLVYTSAGERGPLDEEGVYTLDLDSGISTRLTTDAPANVSFVDAVWSRDGQRIAYRHNLVSKAAHLSVSNADGTGWQDTGVITLANADVIHPKWSPDGERLLYQTFVELVGVLRLDGGPDAEPECIVCPEGADSRAPLVFEGDTLDVAEVRDYAWTDTPDVFVLVVSEGFIRANGEYTARVYQINAVTREVTRLLSSSLVGAHFALSPNGAGVAVISMDGDRLRMRVRETWDAEPVIVELGAFPRTPRARARWGTKAACLNAMVRPRSDGPEAEEPTYVYTYDVARQSVAPVQHRFGLLPTAPSSWCRPAEG